MDQKHFEQELPNFASKVDREHVRERDSRDRDRGAELNMNLNKSNSNNNYHFNTSNSNNGIPGNPGNTNNGILSPPEKKEGFKDKYKRLLSTDRENRNSKSFILPQLEKVDKEDDININLWHKDTETTINNK